MLRDEMLYIDTEVKTIGTAQNVKDEIARSAFIEAERFTNTGTHTARQESAGSALKLKAEVLGVPPSHKVTDIFPLSAYNIKVTDFVPLVNVIQPQRAIKRQLEY